MRVLAVDWSGSLTGAKARTWLAEAVDPGHLEHLAPVHGNDLVSMLFSRDSQTVLGLDFAFAFPAWFMHQLGCQTAHDLWRLAAEAGEGWLLRCDPPFWGRPGRPRPLDDGLALRALPALRRTELQVPSRPKSVFQIGGAGSVGTGSIRGMPLLLALHEAGAHIWPFDPPGGPLVLEIYPRLLTGPVNKSDPSAREAFLRARYPDLDRLHFDAAAASEDAFDAAVSALVMLAHRDDLSALPDESDALMRLEGRIWHPYWRAEVRLTAS